MAELDVINYPSHHRPITFTSRAEAKIYNSHYVLTFAVLTGIYSSSASKAGLKR